MGRKEGSSSAEEYRRKRGKRKNKERGKNERNI
jgi:hypothetical protein